MAFRTSSLQGRLDIPTLLGALAREFGIKHLVVERGAKTNAAFLATRVDELRVFVAPALDGAEMLDHGVVQPA